MGKVDKITDAPVDESTRDGAEADWGFLPKRPDPTVEIVELWPDWRFWRRPKGNE